MRFYKIIYNGYIQRIGVGEGGIEISQEEYEYLSEIINNKPIAESGYIYKLKDNLEWELNEAPIPIIDEDEDLDECYEITEN